MRIGVDARGITLYKGTGIGTYTENVLKNILNVDKENHYNIYWCGKDYTEYCKENSKVIMVSKKQKSFFEQLYFPTNLIKENIDLYHVPQNGIGLYENIHCKKVITIHDLIPYIMPQTVGKGYLNNFLKEIPKLVNNSNGIITVSEWSKRDILKFFPIVDENKIFVTPLAADSIYRPMDKERCAYILNKLYNIKKPFILYIGGFSSRKNVDSLIIAFSKIYKKLNKEYNLVIVGANKDTSDYLTNLSNNLNISSQVMFTGFVPTEHLPLLYNGCDLFVYPSLYEGFGLPPLEAMSCGTCVISSNLSSIPEVIGDGGILIDPLNIKDLAIAIEKVLNNSSVQESLKSKALKRSSLFSWEDTAKKTLQAYTKVFSQ